MVKPPISKPGSPTNETFSFFFKSLCLIEISLSESLTKCDRRTWMFKKNMSICGAWWRATLATRERRAVKIICCSESCKNYQVKDQKVIGFFVCLGQYYPFCDDTKNKRVLAVSELSGTLWALPVEIILHQIYMIQRRIVKLGVVQQRRITCIICSIW